MKKTFIFCFSLFYTLTLNAQKAQFLTDTLEKRFTAIFNSQNIKSAVAAVRFDDGSTWESARGNSDSAPTNENHLFEMGSNTKTMVAAIILQMQEEGKLLITDSIYQYIDTIANVSPSITIKHLLNHTSGIYDYTSDPDFADLVNNNLFLHIPPDTILANYVNAPLFSPGTSFSYCNTGYIILGKIIEAVDQVEFHVSLRNRLLSPLQLNEIFLGAYENPSIPRAGVWLANNTFIQFDIVSLLSAAWAAGAIWATPLNLADWAFLLYSGQVLDSLSLEEMIKPTVIGSNTVDYGLGFIKTQFLGKTYYGHGGTTIQHSAMTYGVDSKFSIVVNVNQQNKSAQLGNINEALIRVIESELPKAPVTSLYENTKELAVQLFPNPATDVTNVVFSKPITGQLNLVDLQGKLVYSQILSGKRSISLGVHNLDNGIYFIHINNQNIENTVLKLVVY